MLAANSNETIIKQRQQQQQQPDSDQYHRAAKSSSASSSSPTSIHRHGHKDSIVSPILYRPTLISTIAHHHLLHHHQTSDDHHNHKLPSKRTVQFKQPQSTSVLSNVLLSNRFIAYAEQSAYHNGITYAPLPSSSSSTSATLPTTQATNAKNCALVKISPTANKLRLQHQKRLFSLCPTEHQIDLRYRRYFKNRTYCDLISRCGNRGLAIENLKLNSALITHQNNHIAHGGGGTGSDWPHHSSIEMLDILRSLRSLLKISRIHTDGNIFRLHYSLTVIILMAFCIIITTKQYVGDPIDCIRAEGIDKSIINTFCWIHTTYSIPRAFNKKVGVDVGVKITLI